MFIEDAPLHVKFEEAKRLNEDYYNVETVDVDACFQEMKRPSKGKSLPVVDYEKVNPFDEAYFKDIAAPAAGGGRGRGRNKKRI